MRPLRCAVVGLGRLGKWHAEHLIQMKDAEVVVVCDPFADRAKEMARELQVPYHETNASRVMQREDIDAVIIAASTGAHYALIQEALRYDKAVFVEKPLAATLEEAASIKATMATLPQSFLQVGFMRRFDPAYEVAKQHIAKGAIGEPKYYKGITRDPGSPPAEFIKNSGGIFLDLAIHDYDAARFLLGAEVNQVTSCGQTIIHDFMTEYGDIDQSMTFLTFDNGACADIEASRNAFYGYDIRGEIVGTEGTLMIGELAHHDVKLYTKKGATYDLVPGFPERFGSAYQRELAAFTEAVQNKQPSPVTVEDGLKALEIAYAATRSFKQQQSVRIESHVPF